MVRKNTLKATILGSFMLSFTIASAFINSNFVYANCSIGSGQTECDDDQNFQVNVPGVLTVQITRPNSWATGDVGVFLRNIITLNVASNNPAGFTASMTSDSTTAAGAALSNVYSGSNSTIPMLSSDWTRSDTSTTKFWGYSLNDSSETGTYSALALKNAVNPITLIPSGTLDFASKDIYFGAKADSSVDSGTYQGTVIISVVTGTITEDNPVIPVNPATPADTTTNNPSYTSGTPGRTVYTARTYDDSDTNTSTIQVSEGDTRSSYQAPHGVSTAQINEGTPLATGLAVTAAASATAGIIFFIVARRRDDDDDEEEY